MNIETAESVLSISNFTLLFAAILVVLGTFGTIKANAVIQKHDQIRKSQTDIKIAEAKQASSDADARAAEANERAAKLENETQQLKKQTEEAKAESERLKERILKIQSVRKLTTDQVEEIAALITSDVFKTNPPPTLRVAAVGDSEAQIFAMEFLNLLALHRINVSPTPYWAPNVCQQKLESENGLLLQVHCYELTPATQPFVHFANLLESFGLATDIQVSPILKPNEAMLNILRKPKEA